MKKVGIIGFSSDPRVVSAEELENLRERCEKLGEELAKKGYIIFNGGRDGIMEMVSKGVEKAGGTSIGILPFDEKKVEANPFISIPVYTGLDYQMRSLLMMKNVDVVISIGGAVGTAIEIFAAYANGIPIILFTGTGGWTDKMANCMGDDMYIDGRKLAPILKASSIEEILDILEELSR